MSDYSSTNTDTSNFNHSDNPFSHQVTAQELYRKVDEMPADVFLYYTSDTENPDNKLVCHHPYFRWENFGPDQCGAIIPKGYAKGHFAKHIPPQYQCKVCQKWYKQKSNVLAHINKVHLGNYTLYRCTVCSKVLSNKYTFNHHYETQHKF